MFELDSTNKIRHTYLVATKARVRRLLICDLLPVMQLQWQRFLRIGCVVIKFGRLLPAKNSLEDGPSPAV